LHPVGILFQHTNDSNLCVQGTAKHYYVLYNALAKSKHNLQPSGIKCYTYINIYKTPHNAQNTKHHVNISALRFLPYTIQSSAYHYGHSILVLKH